MAEVHGNRNHAGVPQHIDITLCTPGTGVSSWGESPLYVNPAKMVNILAKVLAEGKGVAVRHRLKGLSEVKGEPQARATERSGNPERKAVSRPVCVRTHRQANRNGIQGPVSG